MADQQQHGPGGYYSGKNKIPTVDKFLSSLDKDKKARDAEIDAAARQKQADRAGKGGAEAVPHQPSPPQKGGKQVTDPVTGKEIEVCSRETISFRKRILIHVDCRCQRGIRRPGQEPNPIGA
jgi:hypothetical protein